MGGGYSNIDPIIYYYTFQKEINQNLNDDNEKNESKNINKGYIIDPEWINHWKSLINYDFLITKLDNINFEKTDINNKGKKNDFNNFIRSNEIEINDTSKFIIKNNFMILNEKILFFEKYLEFFVDKETFNKLKINENTSSFEEIEFIFKKKMIIFFLEKYSVIIILFHSSYIDTNTNTLNNIKFVFDFPEVYESFCNKFKNMSSGEIIEYLININIFDYPKFQNYDDKNNVITFTVTYEESLKKSLPNNDLENIKNPNTINFNLSKYPSFRGLDNVGATCYMNATLQCLANIKPVTDYFLRKDKYLFLYQNANLCNLTLNYIQVLIGLFCNESNARSYCPEEFKKVIGEYNPLFRGQKANDSKDLIIFLLEIINNELVKINKKKHNIIENGNEIYRNIDSSNENMILNIFLNNYKKSHCSIIGDNFCGIQKTFFNCQNCNGKAINFNIFNLLIFSLEATSNYFNLSNNNTIKPVINFDNCFQFLSKEESFQNTYCQKCGQTCNSIYKESLYTMPNYLIIILNRGKGNIFNCHVEIPEIFAPSIYVEKDKDNKFELIGIVSHFGESGMGGHFIAFCKHSIDGKWRIYNDSTVTECQNDYLQKGTPYILFYKKVFLNGNNCIQNLNGMNQGIFNIPQNNIYNQFNNNNIYNYNLQQMNQNNNFPLNMNNISQQNMFMNINSQQNMNMNNNFQPNINMNNYFQQNMNMNNYFQSNMNNYY